MSLLRLLAIGKSIVSIKDKPNQYRMVRWSWPPKFCCPANPFAGASEASGPADAARSTDGSGVNSQQVSAARGATGPVGTHEPVVEKAEPRAKVASKFLGTLNLFSAKNDLGLRAQGSARRGSHQHVQCELSLETVKVVRNDLSDADIEVVPVRSDPAKALAKVNAAVAARTLSGTQELDQADESGRSCELVRPV